MNRYRSRLEGKTWIAAHRGASGGNIPCNSLPAFQAALFSQADVIELDVSESLDGTLYVFHPGMEPVFLNSSKLISEMHDHEVQSQFLHNGDATPTQWGVPLLDDVLQMLKDKCIINVDKFWMNIPAIAQAIRQHHMQDQVIIKTPLAEEYLKQVEEFAPDMPFMPVISTSDEIHEYLLKKPKIRYIGMEIVFSDEDSPLASTALVEKVHRDDCILWLNTLIYNHHAQMAAYHSDDTAMAGDLHNGWGWAIEKGYDILQTDWPLEMRLYGSKKYSQQIAPIRSILE